MVKRALSSEEKVQRALDFQEISNLANLYNYKLGGGKFKDVEAMFAQKTPGVRVEMMWGIYEGTEGVVRLFSGFHGMTTGKPGFMAELVNASPIVEVAGDGKTAKAVFTCLGHETHPLTGQMQAFWTYGKRAFDFIKEDGEWKIWHYHVYGGYMTPFEKSWVEGFDHIEYPMPEEFKPDKPPTTYWMYKPDTLVPYQPLPPEPYETFDEKTAY